MDLPYSINNYDEFVVFIKSIQQEHPLSLPSSLLSSNTSVSRPPPTIPPPYPYLIIEVHLSSIKFSNQILELFQILFTPTRKIFLSYLGLINCKLQSYLSQLLQLIAPHITTSFRLNLHGSCHNQQDIQTLVTFPPSPSHLIGLHLAARTTSRLVLSDLLLGYQQSNTLLSLTLDGNLLSSRDIQTLSHLLSLESCMLRELSLRSCGFSRDENNFIHFISSLAINKSLFSLDISKNFIRNHEIAASCLNLISNHTLKKLLYEETPLTPQTLHYWGQVVRFSSIRYLSFKECSIQDDGLESFIHGFQSDSDSIYSTLSDESRQSSSAICPILAVLDLSYNKLTNMSLLEPLFHPNVGLSELSLSGNKLSLEEMQILCNILRNSENLQRLHLTNCGLDRHSSSVLFHMLLSSWSRTRKCSFPLVELAYPLVSSTDRHTLLKYLEWRTDPLILRHDGDDISRGIPDTVTIIPPQTIYSKEYLTLADDKQEYHRLLPPISVLNLESNRIGWMGASVLSTCLTTRKWNPLEELYLSGNYIGIRGFESYVQTMITNNKLRVLDLKQSDLVLDDNDDDYIPPSNLDTQSSSTLLYTLPWPIEKKITFLLCLKFRDSSSHTSDGRGREGNLPIHLTEDTLVIIFSYLRIPMYRLINIH